MYYLFADPKVRHYFQVPSWRVFQGGNHMSSERRFILEYTIEEYASNFSWVASTVYSCQDVCVCVVSSFSHTIGTTLPLFLAKNSKVLCYKPLSRCCSYNCFLKAIQSSFLHCLVKYLPSSFLSCVG